MKKQILISISIITFLLIATSLVIMYGRGYRFGFENGKPDLTSTGLLVATSNPNGAQVFINDHLTTATDNTLNLFPGTYKVRIYKEGYLPWEKEIKIQKEVVAKAEALLFSTAPKLESITASGVENPVVDPSLTRIAYTVTSVSAKKNGIYILDMSTKLILTLQSASSQITDDSIDIFSKASLAWSPDGTQLVATVSAGENQTTYLLPASGFNDSPKDVTQTLTMTESAWQKEKLEKEKARLDSLKPILRKIILKDFTVLSWSPDETKILYKASGSATIPLVIKPRMIGTDSAPEERTIKKGVIYVYDIKEDKNFKILEELSTNCDISGAFQLYVCHLPLNWTVDSKHLVRVWDKRINIMDYDGLNSTTVYAGPFVDNYVFPWTNASKILILTNLNNPNIPANLYTIELK
ncbi:MAG: PEGA domain-containing protein [Candidatus Levybacteria bacterium]|nr:PEGA domain-containing protein [Candidatus Levybacteria bacterium]